MDINIAANRVRQGALHWLWRGDALHQQNDAALVGGACKKMDMKNVKSNCV